MPLLLAIALLVAAPTRDSVHASAERTVVLRHATIVDVVGERLIADQAIVISGKRIVSVVPDRRVRVPHGAAVVDCTGQYVMPGLWDMHVHIPEIAYRADPAASAKMGWDYTSALLVANGVTGVRIPAGNLQRLQGWRRDVEKGLLIGPRMVLTGQKLGEQPVISGAPFPIRTDADARLSVRQLRDAGADFVKLSPGLPVALWRAAADEARRIGIPIVGHSPATVALTEASRLGLHSVEHLLNLPRETSLHDEPLGRPSLLEVVSKRTGQVLQWLRVVDPTAPIDEQIATHDTARAAAKFTLLHQQGTWVTPTLVLTASMLQEQDRVFANNRRRYLTRDIDIARIVDTRGFQRRLYSAQLLAFNMLLVREMQAAGVDLLAGSDAPTLSVPGFALHDELSLLVRAGLSPAAALRTATANVGRFLRADSVGVLRDGAVADVIVLAENPLRDISATRRIRGVVAGGRYFSRSALDDLLDSAAAIAAKSLEGRPATQVTDIEADTANRR
ncbi:MAG: Adenine deaminase [Gemmatimonadaceae bacterium]|nr:Adenine deaminase [Gemmatimonadaceae bacterium]